MKVLKTKKRRMAEDEGTALTEFAIVAPLFIVLIYWSQFFVDIGVLKLKAEEAARYAVWEMTAHRDAGAVANEVRTRFADLESPASLNGTRPAGTRSFTSVQFNRVDIQDRIEAKFAGNINRPPSDGSFLGNVIEGIAKFMGKAADWIIKQLKFDTKGMARAEIEMSVQNTLFPTGNVLGIFFDSGINPRVTVRARTPNMLWNTWKAWPGKGFGGSVEADPYDTYPRISSKASVPEEVVSKQVSKMTFFGVGDKLSGADSVFAFLKLPGLFGAKTWKEKRPGDGPIVMLPGAPQTRSFQPGYQTPLQRIGNEWQRTVQTTQAPSGSADPGTDRQRFTLPSNVKSAFWAKGDDGGKGLRINAPAMVRDNANPYVQMYRCRDAYYMGAKREQLQHYGQQTWFQQAYQGCQ